MQKRSLTSDAAVPNLGQHGNASECCERISAGNAFRGKQYAEHEIDRGEKERPAAHPAGRGSQNTANANENLLSTAISMAGR